MTQALLLLDLQPGVVHRFHDAGETIDAVRRALDAARRFKIPVVFVRVGFRSGYPEVHPNNHVFGPIAAGGTGFLADGTADTDVLPTLERLESEPVVLKKRISAFAGNDLDLLLRSQAIDHLVVAGIATSGVVLSTVREAADRDYRLTILADGCTDSDDDVHNVLINKIFPRQATVLRVSDWVASLPKTTPS